MPGIASGILHILQDDMRGFLMAGFDRQTRVDGANRMQTKIEWVEAAEIDMIARNGAIRARNRA